jgi:hypothetical protein
MIIAIAFFILVSLKLKSHLKTPIKIINNIKIAPPLQSILQIHTVIYLLVLPGNNFSDSNDFQTGNKLNSYSNLRIFEPLK